MANYMQGIFKPKHPEKYRGNVNNITYRSSWELSYMSNLDTDPNVVSWGSEEVILPYFHPITKTLRRYFTDFVVTRIVNGIKVTQLIEIKPYSQTKPPVITKNKKKKTMLTEQITYATNLAKWEAADKYCKKKGWEFVLITEKQLGKF